jgi:hypothetical protein
VNAFTLIHVLISLVGIGAGFTAMIGWARSTSGAATALFFVATALTTVTGFLFPFTRLLPSHIIGLLSLVTLGLGAFALYRRRLAGVWRPTFTVAAMLSLYLNVFVLIFQAFLKVPVLKASAPTQAEPPFLAAQIVLLLTFVALTVFITRSYHSGNATQGMPVRRSN